MNESEVKGYENEHKVSGSDLAIYIDREIRRALDQELPSSHSPVHNTATNAGAHPPTLLFRKNG